MFDWNFWRKSSKSFVELEACMIIKKKYNMVHIKLGIRLWKGSWN